MNFQDGWRWVDGVEIARGQSKSLRWVRGQTQGLPRPSSWGYDRVSERALFTQVLEQDGAILQSSRWGRLQADPTRVSLHFLGHVRMIEISVFHPEKTQVAKPHSPRASKKTGKEYDATWIQHLGHADRAD